MRALDRKEARLLLELCRYTYATGCEGELNVRDGEDALSWINAADRLDSIRILKDDKPVATSVACVASFWDKNVVAYMGTTSEFKMGGGLPSSILDWAQNFRVLPVPFKLTEEQLGGKCPEQDNLGGLVHKGFLDELRAVQAKVVSELLKHDGKTKPLFVTGHSQGGAEATLATRAFLAGGFPVAATYTFAAPRTGDKDFAFSIPATLPFHRIEFGDDVVPHIPPLRLGWLFQNIGGQLAKKVKGIPEQGQQLLDRMIDMMDQADFVGTGRLCYGDNDERKLHVDLNADGEKKLFWPRLWKLLGSRPNWGEHHHLVGTTEDVSAGRIGNYTALVSDFEVVHHEGAQA